ncbi:NKG2-A/NKG2-B type II integral membrane protein-like [Carlito syrichta]|uniref:NKG2-A/NKG2-B type II integral membrane protein-like n=1 Tax=Carlito syrichta TaxID=1868482 RepID=A0A3Q0EEW9_CARSF|nr:NKG2-A/NKG2-B type II integral membrane protein-like [Carlito syrichta]
MVSVPVTIIYSKFNLPPNPKNQERKSKGKKSSILVTEQEITYVKLSLQTASQDLLDNDKTLHSKDLPSPPKKITAEILAIICIVLMASVLKTIVLIFSTATQKQANSIQNARTQKAHNCSCPEEWFTYSNSCYYIGKETKTWEESRMACASMNSSLLYIDDEEEMKFLVSLVREAWIGVFRNSSDHPWVSIKGSMFKYK